MPERTDDVVARTAHTPGPWTLSDAATTRTADENDGEPDNFPHVYVDTGDHCAAVTIYNNVSESVLIANARLIAAAPDLLAACEKAQAALGDNAMSQSMGGSGITTAYYQNVDRKLRAAIAKAEGGEA